MTMPSFHVIGKFILLMKNAPLGMRTHALCILPADILFGIR